MSIILDMENSGQTSLETQADSQVQPALHIQYGMRSIRTVQYLPSSQENKNVSRDSVTFKNCLFFKDTDGIRRSTSTIPQF